MTRRFVSAAVGIPAIVGVIALGVPAIGILAIVTGLAAGFEIARMATPRIGPLNIFAASIPAAGAGAGLALGLSASSWTLLLAVLMAGAIPSLLLETMRVSRSRASYISIPAALFVAVLLAHAPMLRSLEDGGRWIFFAVLVTFAIDSAAFFVGRSFGRIKFAPRISPAKTWEGVLAGLIAGAGVGVALATALGLEVSPIDGLLLGLTAAGGAVAGDLTGSMLKRLAGVKDAGGMIPGHGGIIDRIDSLAPNLAIVYWSAVWLTQ